VERNGDPNRARPDRDTNSLITGGGQGPDGRVRTRADRRPSALRAAFDVLSRFLHALGVPAEQVPTQVDEAAARFRSLLADKRVLILLDNARDADQIRPHLPGGPGCVVVTTSRNQLSYVPCPRRSAACSACSDWCALRCLAEVDRDTGRLDTALDRARSAWVLAQDTGNTRAEAFGPDFGEAAR
jgi:hypothetical protein